MNKNDLIGLGTSLAVHLLLFLFLTMVGGAAPQFENMGYIEVEFGPLAEGRAVLRSVEDRLQPEETPSEREPQPRPSATPPEEARPVDLPDQEQVVRDEEQVETPESELIAPEEPTQQEETVDDDANLEASPQAPPGVGAADGDTGSETGEEGEGTDDQASAPFHIEGLNRTAVHAPLPAYTSQVNATIQVRITVDPRGRIVQRFPLIKGDPALEQSVMQALEQWRFDPLPSNAPQETQTGRVTFRFYRE